VTKQEIAALACRLMGVYALLLGLGGLAGPAYLLGLLFGETASRPVQRVHLFWQACLLLLPVVLHVGARGFLWVLADKLAGRMVAPAPAPPPKSRVGARQLQAIAFSVVGLFLLARAIPDIAHAVTAFAFTSSEHRDRIQMVSKPQAVGLGVQVVPGLGLLFGGRGLAGIVQTVRTAGRAKAPPPAGGGQ